ncbi:hypothetical protein LZ30DRAFT_716553 [Colletotrichum cereale]|nr:hypothetical protein LZ30DRAFT_716553 [Colletotrichum cereale]
MFDRTMSERRRAEYDPGRIEVVAFTTSIESTPLTPRDRVEACVRHFEQERNSRLTIADLANAKSWFLPERINDEWYAWGIIVIDRLEERWEEALGYLEDHPDEDPNIILDEDAIGSPFGSSIVVYWQPREDIWERYEEPVTAESRVPLKRMKLGVSWTQAGSRRIVTERQWVL